MHTGKGMYEPKKNNSQYTASPGLSIESTTVEGGAMRKEKFY